MSARDDFFRRRSARIKFERDAFNAAQRKIGVPTGSEWFGVYKDVSGPNGVRVRLLRRYVWAITQHGEEVSVHGSRVFAIRKAVVLSKVGAR